MINFCRTIVLMEVMKKAGCREIGARDFSHPSRVALLGGVNNGK